MNYNYIAPYYDLLSRICFLNRQQIAHKIILKYLKANDKILWLGGGSGWFLEEINELNILVEIDYVELSTVMINKAKTRNHSNLKVNFYKEDIFKFETNQNYNIVITAFIFDHFSASDCEVLFTKFNPNLIIEGKWFCVEFNENQNLIQRFLTKSMVVFFNLIAGIKTKDFPKIDHLFNDFNLIEEKQYFWNYIQSKVYKK
ncbi:methyltransferase domain-containing protein [Faecalibacter macacae]|uniref:Class I SAM-dependent methyltransferase n=1 Tax=Faecalibacter macacae TaxID=1859289 RepID=A0A3L9MD54_9FLAO|nr:class I SAM-dependent methyltransferase [Faecalibacter macacae]RLZ10771.1 class I SAM-dependent methyltransferase [Faecalibacter macacae]